MLTNQKRVLISPGQLLDDITQRISPIPAVEGTIVDSGLWYTLGDARPVHGGVAWDESSDDPDIVAVIVIREDVALFPARLCQAELCALARSAHSISSPGKLGWRQ